MAPPLSRQLVTHGGLYTIARFANKGALFLLLPVFAHILGEGGFGIVSLMQTVGAFLGFLFLQGLHGAWYRLRFEQKTTDDLHAFETTICWYLLGSTVVLLVLLAGVGPALARWITPGVPFHPYGMLTALAAAGMLFGTLYELKLQAEQRPVAFGVFALTRTVVNVALVLVLIAGVRRGARGKLEADAIAAGLGAVAGLVLIRPGGLRLFSRPKAREALAYGLPLVPHNLAALANDMIDRLLINGMLGLGATGVYAMGYQVASIGLLLAMALNQAYSPLFIRQVKEIEATELRGDTVSAERLRKDLARAGLLTVAATAVSVILLSAVAREALAWLTPSSFDDSWRVVAPVSAGVIAWACYFPFAQAVSYDRRRVRLLPGVTFGAAVVNVLANLVLIPRFGIMGAAWATLLSNLTMATVALHFGQNTIRLPYPRLLWTRLLLLSAVALAGIWCLDGFVKAALTRCLFKYAFATVLCYGVVRAIDLRPAVLRRVLARQEGA